MRLAICSDGHWRVSRNGPVKNATSLMPYERRAWLMVQKLLEEHKRNPLDAVLYNGDLAYHVVSDLQYVKKVFDTLTGAGIYVHYGYGNHDRATNEEWRALFGYSRSSHFVIGDYAVLCPNSSDESGTYKCVNPQWLDYWLTKYADKAGIVVCTHIYQNGVSYSGVDCTDVIARLEATPNLSVVVNSHHHMKNDVLGTDEGLRFAFTGNFSYTTDETTPDYGFRVVELTDSVKRTYQRDILTDEIVNETALGGTERMARVRTITATSNETVNAGQNAEAIVSPAEGYMARILQLFILAAAPSGATTGDHSFRLYQGSNTNVAHALVKNAYNKSVDLRYGTVRSSGEGSEPNDGAVIQRNLFNTRFTESVPLVIRYYNDTDANQTGTRSIIMVVEEEAVI